MGRDSICIQGGDFEAVLRLPPNGYWHECVCVSYCALFSLFFKPILPFKAESALPPRCSVKLLLSFLHRGLGYIRRTRGISSLLRLSLA